MAEHYEPQQKRRKFIRKEQIRNENKFRLTEDIANCIAKLNSCHFQLLKVVGSDAAFDRSFSESFCKAEAHKQRFFFKSVFDRGIQVLNYFFGFDSSLTCTLSKEELCALDLLMEYLVELKDDDPSLLHAPKQKLRKKEQANINWTLQICHHLLSDLVYEGDYVVNHCAKYLGAVNLAAYGCPCCDEPLTGQTGDTYMGNDNVWHGRADVLLGPVAIVNPMPDVDEEDIKPSLQLSTSKMKRNLPLESSRLISETIVFSLLQRKQNQYNLQKFLIPTIGISKSEIVFFCYDSIFDILLKSNKFQLFELTEQGTHSLKMDTVVALWLTLNYPLFCTGVVKPMLSINHKANFLDPLPEDVKHIYRTGLRLGYKQTKNVSESSESDTLELMGGPPAEYPETWS